MKKRWISIIIICGLVAIDQITKWVIYFSDAFPLGQAVPVITFGDTVIISFYKIINRGAGLGILEGQTWFFILMAFLAIAALTILLYRFGDFKGHKVLTIGMCFLFSGALGNALDRFTNNGGVIDFLEFTFLTKIPDIGTFFNWSCNFADGCITTGVILILIEFIILDPLRRKKRNAELIRQATAEKHEYLNKNERNNH